MIEVLIPLLKIDTNIYKTTKKDKYIFKKITKSMTGEKSKNTHQKHKLKSKTKTSTHSHTNR